MRRSNCGDLWDMVMTDQQLMPADVLVDAGLSPERQAMLVDTLAALGASARIRVLPIRRGVGDLQWLVLAALPLQAFLSAIGGKIADDAYREFQNVVRKLLRPDRSAEPSAVRPIVLQDSESGLRIVLDHDLPAEGYQQLLALDLSQFRVGPVHYDRAGRRWRSELDEVASASG
jgi:hypothetical protein